MMTGAAGGIGAAFAHRFSKAGSRLGLLVKTEDVRKGPGPESDVSRAAQVLARASNPVILAGGGVTISNAIKETKALAEYLTAPVANTYLHNDSFPADHLLTREIRAPCATAISGPPAQSSFWLSSAGEIAVSPMAWRSERNWTARTGRYSLSREMVCTVSAVSAK